MRTAAPRPRWPSWRSRRSPPTPRPAARRSSTTTSASSSSSATCSPGTRYAASMPGLRPLTKATYLANWIDVADAGRVRDGPASRSTSPPSLLVLALARRWIRRDGAGLPATGPRRARDCALVFALHPAQTEAVVYIAGRSTSLSDVRSRSRRSRVGARARRIARRVDRARDRCCCSSLALAAREAAWTLPFAIVLVELARGRAHARRAEAQRAAGDRAGVLAALVLAIAANRQLLRDEPRDPRSARQSRRAGRRRRLPRDASAAHAAAQLRSGPRRARDRSTSPGSRSSARSRSCSPSASRSSDDGRGSASASSGSR